MDKIYFGMGCFWSAQYIFQKHLPDNSTTVGYIDGIEVVEVSFEKKDIDKLLKVFFENHSFILKEIPEKYQSAIFYTPSTELNIIKMALTYYNIQIKKSGYDGYRKTKIAPVNDYKIADESNQFYLNKNPDIKCMLGFNKVIY